MVQRSRIRHKYSLSCLLSSTAGVMALVNPVLAGVLVARYKERLGVLSLMPVAAAILLVKGVRMYLRGWVSRLLGGSQRAPLIWLQHRIGSWLWWLEPMLHNWGWAGMLVTRLAGERGVPAQIASSALYSVTDTGATVLSGVIYYYTESYALSLLSILVLPALTVIPWAQERNLRMKTRYGREFKRLVVKKGNLTSVSTRERPPRSG